MLPGLQTTCGSGIEWKVMMSSDIAAPLGGKAQQPARTYTKTCFQAASKTHPALTLNRSQQQPGSDNHSKKLNKAANECRACPRSTSLRLMLRSSSGSDAGGAAS